MATVYGIDISKWQGEPDFSKVKTDPKVQFIIMRAGIGTATDVKYERNYSECKKHGIPCGAYWYSKALTPAAARSEAKACIKALSGKQFEYPIYMDVEDNKQLALSKTAVTEIVEAFCSELEAAGYFVGIYGSRYPLVDNISTTTRQKYTMWIAHYGVNKTNYPDPYAIWQKSDKGSIKGINGNVDLDECYQDFPSIIKASGKNGFVKNDAPATRPTPTLTPTPTTTPKPVQTNTKLYNVKVICHALNVRSGPGVKYKATTVVYKNQIYSIVEEKNGWGRLISGAGWISLSSAYVKRI